MRHWLKIIVSSLLLLAANAAHATQSCEQLPDWHSIYFEGEVAGKNSFTQSFDDKTFSLIPTQYGWQIAVINSINSDLAGITVPTRLVDTNPRFISGWHFRNLNNSGANQGDVNAPQNLREFSYGSMTNPSAIGHGELLIEDMGLSDLAAGQKARMSYLKFSTCIHWPKSPEPLNLAQTADFGVPAHMAIFMQQCGLDPKLYKLSDRMTKGVEGGQEPLLRPDFNGDGTADVAIPITRLSDNAPGLAICLANEDKLLIIGYNGRIGKHFDPAYFNSVDFWTVQTQREFDQGNEESAPPTATGDSILLAKSDSSSALLYLDKTGKVNSYWQGD